MSSEPKSVPQDTVLELRIHGVNNTPPHEMLDLPKDDVVLAFGDELGSFWQPTPEAVAKGRTDQVQGDTRGVVDPAEVPRGRVPAGIHRESYSWGGMVRTTLPDTGPGGVIVATAARAAWTLLLPFSIANAAIWGWKLPSRSTGTGIRFGSAIIRLACLTLTMIFVLALGSVAIDLLALQCYRDGSTVCPPLAGTVDVFENWTDERRVALFSLIPIVALLVVYVSSSLATLRYNVAGRIRDVKDGTLEQPLLADRRFWLSRKETQRLALLHLTVGIATVALLIGFALEGLSTAFAQGVQYASIAVIVFAAVLTARTDSAPYETIGPYSPVPKILLGLAIVLYAISALILGFNGDITLVPREIGIASDHVLVVVVVIAIILIVIAWLLPSPRGRRKERAWRGHGPAVFLTIGLAISLILGSLINVIIGDWLNGASPASRLDEPYTACVGDGCQPRQITLGTFYAPFLGITLAAAIVAVAILALMAVRKRDVSSRAPTSNASQPANTGPREVLSTRLQSEVARKRRLAARAHLAEPFIGVLAIAFFVAILITVVRPLADWVATMLPDSSKASLDTMSRPFQPMTRFYETVVDPWMARWVNASLGVWVLIGALILVGLVFGGKKTTRPLALIWDLACFLPRAGHPFGAPCYTERAVPEVARRVAWWLDLDDPSTTPVATGSDTSASGAAAGTAAGASPHRRTVILSAHSMGAVVAVSALFALRGDPKWQEYRDRVSLLTFGIQLRPYFGRFFPEILGPDVIDCTPCARPKVWGPDPWKKSDIDRTTSRRPTAVSSATSVVPGKAWISLWRLTDYLGFPVKSTASDDNLRDRYAEEVDASGYVGVVDTHGWYYRTPTYQRALATLVREMETTSDETAYDETVSDPPAATASRSARS